MSKEANRKALKPSLSLDNRALLEEEVVDIVSKVWNWDVDVGSIKVLDSYDDFNVYIRPVVDGGNSGDNDQHQEYLLKLYNGVDSTMNLEILEGLGAMMSHIKSNSSINVPIPMPIYSHQEEEEEEGRSKRNANDYMVLELPRLDGSIGGIACRLFAWVKGNTLNQVSSSIGPFLLFNLGRLIGSMTHALSTFDHAAFHRSHDWDLRCIQSCRQFFDYVEDEDVRRYVCEASSRMERLLADNVTEVDEGGGIGKMPFQWSIIMGDANDANIIVSDAGSSIGSSGGGIDNGDVTILSISGIIDFGDAVYTWTICEIAIALAYALLSPYSRDHPLRVIGCMLNGYHHAFPHLSEMEIRSLRTLIATRLSLSISFGAYSISINPANRDYLELHSKPAKAALLWIWSQDESKFQEFCWQAYSDADAEEPVDDHSLAFIDMLVSQY